MDRSAPRWLGNRSRMALLAGAVGAGALALGTTASLGGFTASITNVGDRVATGSLLLSESVTPGASGSQTACLSTGAGSAISTNANTGCAGNVFGALSNAVPGAASYSTVVLQDTGSVAAGSLSLAPGSCTAAAAVAGQPAGSDTAGFCGKVDLSIEDETSGTPVCVYPAVAGGGACPALGGTGATTLASLAATYASTPLSLTSVPVAAGASRTYKVAVQIDPSATNADQALAASLPVTFTFGS